MVDESEGAGKAIEEAIRRVRLGDLAAFTKVVELLERPLRAWLVSCTSPGVDIDEVAQRTFVAVYQGLDRYEAGTDFIGWLFTIAHFQLRTELTTLKRARSKHVSGGDQVLTRQIDRLPEETPEIALLRLEYLKGCVEKLSGEARQIIHWKYERGHSLEEIARRTGRSEGAIKKHLWKIRQALKECVERRMGSSENTDPGGNAS